MTIIINSKKNYRNYIIEKKHIYVHVVVLPISTILTPMLARVQSIVAAVCFAGAISMRIDGGFNQSNPHQ